MKCWHSTLLLHELNFEFVNLRRRSVIPLTLFCILKQSVNQLHWSETIDLTISQMAFSFSCYDWKQSNMVHEKIDCNTSYVQTICSISCCLVRQQWRLMVMPVISITGIFLIHQSWTLPLYGFWLWIVCEHEYHRTDKKNRSVITARYAPCCTSDCHNHFLVAACNMQSHCHSGSQDFHRMSCHWVDVTLSQSKSQCLLTSFSQTTRVNNCTLNMVSYLAACW